MVRLVTQLISLIAQSFQIKLSLKTPFESPQLFQMAAMIQKLQNSELPQSNISQDREILSQFSPQETSPTLQPIKKVDRDSKLPLSFASARMWFLEQLNPHTSAYNMPIVIRMEGSLNVVALEESFNAIISRHEILRTAFTMEAGSAIQTIKSNLTLPLKKINLTQLPPDSQPNQIQKWAEKEASQTFDLAQAPLLRATLLQIGARDYVLSLVIHHIIFDAWSIDVPGNHITMLTPPHVRVLAQTLQQLIASKEVG